MKIEKGRKIIWENNTYTVITAQADHLKIQNDTTKQFIFIDPKASFEILPTEEEITHIRFESKKNKLRLRISHLLAHSASILTCQIYQNLQFELRSLEREAQQFRNLAEAAQRELEMLEAGEIQLITGFINKT